MIEITTSSHPRRVTDGSQTGPSSVEDKIDDLLSEIKYLRKEINEIKNSSKKMDLHIDFIERIYEKLKYPIIYISSMFNKNYATLTTTQPESSEEWTASMLPLRGHLVTAGRCDSAGSSVVI